MQLEDRILTGLQHDKCVILFSLRCNRCSAGDRSVAHKLLYQGRTEIKGDGVVSMEETRRGAYLTAILVRPWLKRGNQGQGSSLVCFFSGLPMLSLPAPDCTQWGLPCVNPIPASTAPYHRVPWMHLEGLAQVRCEHTIRRYVGSRTAFRGGIESYRYVGCDART